MGKGFTLIELIIVIVISSMVSVFTFSFIYNSIQTYRLMRIQRQLHQEASYALERITRELRDASYNLNSTGGISFTKAHQTPADTNTFVRFYQSGNSLFRCSDAVSGLVCLVNPGSSPTNKPISANVSTFTVQRNTNSEPCGASNLPNCQDDFFSITLALTKDGQTLTIGSTVTPRNYCSNGSSATSCSSQDYLNRSFNRDYRDVAN
jgi:prepilin-type N-terminal cleavage/methylation domain-containing protein